MAPRRSGLVSVSVLVALVVAAGAPATGLAHPGEANTVEDHIAEDSVAHAPAEEPALERHTAAATAADAATAEAAVADDPGQSGQWGPVVDWPVVGVHVALLQNGKVLAYDSVGDNATETYPVHDHSRATIWDPATGTQTPVWVTTGYNVFCSGLAHLTDGSLFVAGGNKNAQLQGIVQTHIFNSATNSWSLGPNMAAGRWYPSVTPLRNGEMLITSGGPPVPEVRKTDGGLRALNTASLSLPLYPWLDVAPDGRAFYSGPNQTMRSLDTTGGGSWQSLGQRDSLNRDYGSRAMYDVGRILVAGGSASSKDARMINLNGAAPQVSATAPMAFGRRQHNLTVLADGTVLATGGNSSGASLVDLNNGVYQAELWSPATGQWRTLAAMQVTRQYHSTALLLPDGRVLSSGGGICGTCDQVGYLAKNAEVFTPPYLFKKDGSGQLAPRPAITSVPNEIPYNVPFAISTQNPGAIGKVALVRLGAVTHSVDMEQRYVPLSFTAGAGALNATSPANANIAPPGVYMLFIVGSDGVPSTAKMVRIGGDNRRPTAVATGTPTSGTAPLTVGFDGTGSSDPDQADSLTYSWDLDGNGGYGDSTSATPSFTYTAAGTYNASLRTTDRWGASDTATVTINVAANRPPKAVATAAPTSGAAPLTVRFDGTGSSDPDQGDTLTYSWDLDADGTYGDSSSATPSFTYTASGTYSARLRVADPSGASDTTAVTIDVGDNTRPTAQITTPASSATWAVGDRIDFAGSGTDAEDGTLPAGALSWAVVLHHCPSSCHEHPVQDFQGVASGSFTAPDHEYPSYLELRLSAKDSQGLTGTTSTRLDPRTVVLNFHSSPEGLQLSVNGTPATAPFTRTVIAGSRNSVSAASPQTAQGKTWEFTSWSDGGAQTHDTTAGRDGGYTASFREQAATCGGGVGTSLILVALCGGPYYRRRTRGRGSG